MIRPLVGRKIAVDFDEVLFPMLSQLNKHYAHKYNKKAPHCPPNAYDYSKHYSINEHDSKVLVESFYHSHYAYTTKPIDYAVQSMKKMKKHNTLFIVTGRQTYKQSKSVTYYLVDKHFPGLFNDVIFTNSYSLSGNEISKSSVCKTLNIDLLIDDSISNCHECESDNIESILYGNYAWNKHNTDLYKLDSWENFHNSN